MPEMITVMRYANRKLYCAESKYTTLRWVRARIVEGRALRVLAHPSGKDVTAATIARIIAEDASEGRLAVGLLMGILRAYAVEGQGDA